MKGWVVSFAIAVSLLGASVLAETSKQAPSCQLQLAHKTVEASNLDADRDAKEQKNAALQVELYFEKQATKQMAAQIEELKKKVEELSPKEEKPADAAH